VLRLSYEGLAKAPELLLPSSKFFKQPALFALHKFAYYECFKCKGPYVTLPSPSLPRLAPPFTTAYHAQSSPMLR
jgi:hypothetical protein